MELLIALGYAAGASVGWWAMDKWLNHRAEKREKRLEQARDITPANDEVL